MLVRKYGFILLILLSFLLSGYRSAGYAEYAPGRIVVKFKPGTVSIPKGMRVAGVQAAAVRATSVSALNAEYGVYELRQLYRRVLDLRPEWTQLEDEYVLLFPEDKNVEEVAEEYLKDPHVLSAYPESMVQAFAVTPNDPSFGQQYGLVNIQAPGAWDRTTGESSVRVAVLDTGINYNHEDLQGRIDLADGYDFVNDDDDPWDDHYGAHGTTVSGVIAAATNNGVGIAGVDWSAKILPIKVLNYNGDGFMSDIKEGLLWAQAKGADIVNMSFGQYNQGVNKYIEENPGGIKDACQDAYDDGIVLVAAAGNGNVEWNTYPAYYSTVLAVAAVDEDDKRATWYNIDPITGLPQASNYGDWVDVAAPGDEILVTQKNNSYVYSNGTSLACPFVAGVAALIKAVNPTGTNQDIMDEITGEVDNIDSLNPGFEGKLGSGRINVYLAIGGVLARIDTPVDDSYVKGDVDVYGTASGWDFSNYVLEVFQGVTLVETIETSSTSVEGAELGSWSSLGNNGEHTIRLRVFTFGSGTEDAQVTVIVDNTTPEADISYPLNGASVTGALAIQGTAKDEYFERYLLEYGQGISPSQFESIRQSWVAVDGGTLGTWETTGLEGIYTIRLRAYDMVGTVVSRSVTVEIQSSIAPPTEEVDPQPPPLPPTYSLPNPFDRTEYSEINFIYSLEGNFETSIFLFDLSGNLIWRRSYAGGTNGGKSGDNDPSWDGKDLFGANVPGGVYVYQIVAGGKVIGKGKVVVLN